jgi:transposase
MAQALHVELSAAQEQELRWARDHHPKAYVRSKCAGILKVAAGNSARQVAAAGLLKPVAEETVSDWIARYQNEGLAGLVVRKGRGRKPAFSPCGLEASEAASQLEEIVHRSPRLYGLDRSGWWLAGLRQIVSWMHKLTLSGIWQILERFELVYKRGRQHVHSPDPLYNEKLAEIEQARDLAIQAPQEVIFLYQDEHTAHLRPQVGRSYQGKGEAGAKATGGTSELLRLAGVLDVATGQVLVRRRQRFNVKEMYRFFYHVEQHYPQADVIYIALDNWPVHFHPYVQEHLAAIHSKIRLLPLPTYAPWTNPIEKFWLKLNREFMKQHPFGLAAAAFRDALDLWLDKHREESAALLHEVGLLPKESLAYPD